ncbi:MAG: NAD(+) diphosphatase [Paracoccaceae bacterium]
MRIAEAVTFGGGGLDRDAGLRACPAEIAALLARPDTRMLPFWKGKPLFSEDGPGWVEVGHPALADATAPPVWLGRTPGGARFAADLDCWVPGPAAAATPTGLFDLSEQAHPLFPAPLRFAELRAVMTRLEPVEAELAATAKALLGWHETHRFCANCGAASEVTHAGWQRTCPACGRAHFPRTDPVVIMLVTRGNSVLVGRSPGWPEGMYSLLAGFVEPGETVEAAARREVAEEAGIRIGKVGYLASQPWPYPASLMIGCRCEALNEDIVLDPAELEAARWLTREDMARVFAGAHPEIRAPRRGAIAGYLLAAWIADRLE